MKKCINIVQIFGCENYKIREMFHFYKILHKGISHHVYKI